MTKSTITEQQLAERVIAFLSTHQWEVFQEVQVYTFGRCADIVARKDGMLWVVETKRSFSLAVLAQIEEWKGMADFRSIAVGSYDHRTDAIKLDICAKYGIGYMLARRCTADVYERLQPSHSTRTTEVLVAHLCEQHKTFAAAGNADGARFTPFAHTCSKLREYVRAHDRCTIAEAIAGIDSHHYRTDATARSSLRKWLVAGSVKGVRLVSDRKPFTLTVTDDTPPRSDADLFGAPTR